MKQASLLALLCLLMMGSVMAELEAYLDTAALRSLAEVSDARQLRLQYDRLSFHDPAIDIVYAMKRYYLLQDNHSADRLLETIPDNPLEFWFLYSITYTDAYTESPALAETVNSYFGTVAQLVVERDKGMVAFLRLSRFSDGEVAAELSDWNEYLQRSAKDRFLKALNMLDAEGRRRVCGECGQLQ